MPSEFRFTLATSALLGLAAIAPLSAETFNVTRIDDPLPGACLVDDCSLREAVLAANAAPVTPELHRVMMPTGTHTLSRGTLVVTGRVEIRGNGSANTRIVGTASEPIIRSTASSSAQVLFATLAPNNARTWEANANGSTSLSGAVVEVGAGGGGDIEVIGVGADPGNGFFRITRSVVPVFVDCGQVLDCTIIESEMLRLEAYDAADIFISESTFDGSLNSARPSGLIADSTGTVEILDSEFNGTTIGLLIAEAAESISFLRSRYIDNDQPIDLDRNIELLIEDSEFRGNRNESISEGPAALSLTAATATATVRRSTFVGNTGNGPFGGAVLVSGGASLNIENSTFSNNSVTVAAAQAGARGGAIGFEADADDITSLSLRHVTMVAPTIAPTGLSGTLIGGTGEEVGLVLDVRNSVLRGSCSLDSALTMDSDLGNIESSGNSCFLDTGANQVNVPANALALGSLGNFGGRTPTYRPAPTSVVVDAANVAQSLAIDQRGYRRPTGTGPDVGAVEQSDEIFRDGFE